MIPKRSYRSAEALLADCDNCLRDVGLHKARDHNTLCRAAKLLPFPSIVVPGLCRTNPSVERRVVRLQPSTSGRPGLVVTSTR